VGEEVLPVAREVLRAADAPRVTLGVRPEDLEVVESGGLLIEADVVEELGADAYVYGRTRFGDSEQQTSPVCMGAIPRPRATPCTFVPAGPRASVPCLGRGATRQLTAAVTQERAVRRRASVCG
jgi:hypothetical protein